MKKLICLLLCLILLVSAVPALSKAGANAFTGAKAKATVTCPKAKLAKYQKLLKKAGLSQTARFKAK